jgi:ABC-type nitrate/sulfonate/bicarbonate transport system ATPase subunit
MVTIEELCFFYQRRVPIFSNFYWRIGKGEIWSIIAPSGYGKSTLLYLLAGLYLPASGEINVDGMPLLGPRLSTGLILQDYGLLPWATAFDNIALGLRIRKVNAKETNRITLEWLSKLNIDAVSHHYPSELSGGQRQRVAIARTLVLQPALLLMDEPFASLDALTRENLQNLVIRIHADIPTMTIILVTHNIEEAAFLGKKILVLIHLPNTEPIIIENPDSGNHGYRSTHHFTEKCEKLRNLLSWAENGQEKNSRKIKL